MLGGANTLAETRIEHRLEFARWPDPWAGLLGLAVLAGLLYAVIGFYRRDARAASLTARARATMAALRCLVLLALAVIWLQPVLAMYIHRRVASCTLVLVDQSASMQLADRYADPAEAARVRPFRAGDRLTTRAEVASALLTADGGTWLRRLAERNAVRLWGFGESPRLLATVESSSVSAAAAATATSPAPSPVTDLSRAVRAAVEEAGDSPIAGIVVLSDGAFNAGEPAEAVGRFAASRGLPIYAVGIGDPSPVRNVRVEEVAAPAFAYVRDPFAVTATLSAEGLAGATVKVELAEIDDRGERVVSVKETTIGFDGRAAPVTFECRAERAGEVSYVVRAPPLDAESVAEDNARATTVRVVDSRMRVLLVAGAPGWDYRYVARLLEREVSADVSCWLQSADAESVRDGTTVITEFPRRADQLMAYDVVAMFDPQPSDFDAAWCEAARAMVSENGAGILYVAGRKFTPRFMVDPKCRPLVEMLPVSVDPEAEILINQLGLYQTQGWAPLVSSENLDHPVLALGESAVDTAAIWQHLASIYWHYPVRREKPLATVLMRHSNPRMRNAYGEHVLLATQPFGAGRTAFLGVDSTWRWRRYGEVYFNRFWIQLFRHLIEGRLGGGRRASLLIDRDSVAPGDPLTISVRFADANGAAAEAVVRALAEDGREADVPLEADPARPGWRRGRFVPTRPGRLQFRLDLPDRPGAKAETLTRTVQVAQPNLEILRPRMDRESLATLAAMSAGGRFCPVDEAAQIPDWIEDRNATIVVSGVPTVLWDRYRWPVLTALVLLMTAEWALRRRANLL